MSEKQKLLERRARLDERLAEIDDEEKKREAQRQAEREALVGQAALILARENEAFGLALRAKLKAMVRGKKKRALFDFMDEGADTMPAEEPGDSAPGGAGKTLAGRFLGQGT